MSIVGWCNHTPPLMIFLFFDDHIEFKIIIFYKELIMFDFVKNAFGIVYVKEYETTIEIGGIRLNTLKEDVYKIWRSSKLLDEMFNKSTGSVFIFDKFFAVDVLYILQQIYLFKRRKSNKFRISNAIDQLKQNTWLRSLDTEYHPKLDYTKLKDMFHTPLPHQDIALKEYDRKTQRMNLNGFLLAADVGTGKSWMSLAISVCTSSEVVIILSPKSIVDRVWVDSVRTEIGEKASIWSVSFNEPLKNGYKYYIANYEYLDKLFYLIPYIRDKVSTIIIDESHNFNDPNSQRSLSLVKLCKESNSKNIIFASGTAVKALGYEMITLLRCIDPYFTENAAIRFKNIYGISAKRAVDVLRHRLDMVSHKIPKEVVMKTPSPIYITNKIKMPNSKKYLISSIQDEMKAFVEERHKYYAKNMQHYVDFYNKCLEHHYKQLKTNQEKNDYNKYLDYVKIIKRNYDPKEHKQLVMYCKKYEKTKIIPSLPQQDRNKFKDYTSIIKYVGLKILGEALGQILSKRREECHTDMIGHIDFKKIIDNADKKTLIFTDFVKTLKAIDDKMKNMGYDSRIVFGETNKDVGNIIDEFKKEPSVNPLSATYKSLSVGVTLINCSVVMLINKPFRPYIVEQAVHRIYRIGQTAQTYVYEFTLDTGVEMNISTRSEAIMEWAKQQVEAILGTKVSSDEMEGIVRYAHMNPDTKYEQAIRKLKKWFN